MTRGLVFGAAAISCLAVAAAAEVNLASVNACLSEARSQGQPVAACLEAAHASCVQPTDDMHMVASLCYEEAREVWGAGIRTRLDQIKAAAPEHIAAVAGIEVKYDLILNLTQCDRIEELSRLTDVTSEAILHSKSRCMADASALTYVRLMLRSADMPTQEN